MCICADILYCCIVVRFHDEVFAEGSGLSSLKRVDFRDVTMRYNWELEMFKEEWAPVPRRLIYQRLPYTVKRDISIA